MKDDLLALEANVLGPLDEAGEVGGGADSLACGARARGEGQPQRGENEPLGDDAPIPKFLGFFSKRGFFLTAEGLAPG